MEIIKNNKINLFQNCSINSGSSGPRTLHHGYSTLEDLDVMAASKDKISKIKLKMLKKFFSSGCVLGLQTLTSIRIPRPYPK